MHASLAPKRWLSCSLPFRSDLLSSLPPGNSSGPYTSVRNPTRRGVYRDFCVWGATVAFEVKVGERFALVFPFRYSCSLFRLRNGGLVDGTFASSREGRLLILLQIQMSHHCRIDLFFFVSLWLVTHLLEGREGGFKGRTDGKDKGVAFVAGVPVLSVFSVMFFFR